jgi:mannan endo-1,4-beta-mannosidase
VDYVTAHIWPQNWGWVDPRDLAGTWDAAEARVKEYLDVHVRIARELGKPLVVEEFGFPRDGESYEPRSPTRFRERYYELVFAAVEREAARGGPLVGSNFWAWSGEARARHDDRRYRDGDPYLGDPPHEPQGWYGIFESDTEMLDIVQKHAERLGQSRA